MTRTTNNGRPLRLVLIIRTSKRKKEARSPQQQRDMAEACAKANGYQIVAVLDSGTNESGKTMDRASIHEAMSMVERGDADGVIVALADRLGRAKIEEAMTTVRAFCERGVLVLADMGGQPVDLDSPAGETFVVQQLQMARHYWLTTANRVRQSQSDAIDDGIWCARTPFGYVKKLGKLVPHPKWGRVVREAFRRAARSGLSAAVAYLEDAAPGRSWSSSDVRRLLARRVYLGESRTGDLVKIGAHEPLTTLEDFAAAQDTPRPRRENGDYPLSGIARCGECGAGLTGQLQTVNGRSYRRYRCSAKSCGGGSSILADRLVDHVRTRSKKQVVRRGFRARFVPGDLNAARDARDAALAELEGYVVETPVRTPGRERGIAVRQEAYDAADEAFAVVASQRARSVKWPQARMLDNDEDLAVWLRATDASVVVARGRGAVEDRVVVAWDDDEIDDGAGVAAA